MRILAADIGGTNSRFSAVDIESLSDIRMHDPLIFPTGLKSIRSVYDLLTHFKQNAPQEMADFGQYQALALGVAGAVSNGRATLPNISWNIDIRRISDFKHIFLLNDFYAQAHAFLDEQVLQSLHTVRAGSDSGSGSVAVVGAGTGLGHAALEPFHDGVRVISSESGHASLSFHGDEEKEIEHFFLTRTGNKWINNEDLISGSGAVLLHEHVSGQTVTPAQALSATSEGSRTCEFFSRFYARACRNYCLAVYPVAQLIISGGVAAKNPHLVDCPAFIEEFDDAGPYRHLFEQIKISLNTDQGQGLKGAAIHAWRQLGLPQVGGMG